MRRWCAAKLHRGTLRLLYEGGADFATAFLGCGGSSRNALFPFTDVIYALTPLRFLGQRHQLEWWLENRGCPDEIRAALEPREHIQPAVVSQMVGYYIRAGAMPAPARADRCNRK